MTALSPAQLARIYFWNEHEFDTSGVEDEHPEMARDTIKALLKHIKATDPQYTNGDGPRCTCERGDVECGPFTMAMHSMDCALNKAPVGAVPAHARDGEDE